VVVDRIIQICSFASACALIASPVVASDDIRETDLYWQALRADIGGKSDKALKDYNRLVGKFPESDVAVDRLFDAAVLQGDFPSALRAARAKQLAETADAATSLIFYVDAWRRRDWKEADQATAWLQDRGVFSFMSPLLNAWKEAGQGKAATLSYATLQANGTLAYYSDDQLVYFDLANNNYDGAKRRLTSFTGFGEDYGRHMGLSAAEHLAQNGQGEFANMLLQHIGTEPLPSMAKGKRFPPELAIAALFSRLSAQLEEQGVSDQALYFARLAQWIAPDSPYARMTLSSQLAKNEQYSEASVLLDAIPEMRPQWSWALADKARVLVAQGQNDAALQLIQSARAKRPSSTDLKLLEAQQLMAKGDLLSAGNIYKALIAAADTEEEKNGRRVTLRMLLAQVHSQQNNWPAAKAILEEALVLNDQNPLLLNSLGYGLLEQREDVKRGFELVSKAHRLAPQSPAITDSLGWGHYLNGDYAKAIPLLERAVEAAINDVTINEHLGDAYWQAGRYSEARYAWRAASIKAADDEAKRLANKIDFGLTDVTAAP
jgi:tetratricopeptide (TPR) repeat protein